MNLQEECFSSVYKNTLVEANKFKEISLHKKHEIKINFIFNLLTAYRFSFLYLLIVTFKNYKIKELNKLSQIIKNQFHQIYMPVEILIGIGSAHLQILKIFCLKQSIFSFEILTVNS